MTGLAGSASLRPHVVSVDEMLDTQALQRLAWAYCHGIDRRDFALVRSLYHDDAFDDHGPMFQGTADEYVAWLPSVMATWSMTAHIIHNMLFLIDGDQAEGELVLTAYHRTLDGRREVIGHGRYIDQYRKRDGVWRFYRRSLALDWMEDREIPGDPDDSIGKGVDMGRPSADDPVYRRLPMFAAQRRG
jgi:hypothetical protein